MPKSKVRKKSDKPSVAVKTNSGQAVTAARSARSAAPSPSWYPVVALVVLLLGLAWMVVYYIAGERVPWMNYLQAWNFAVGFGVMLLGLVMLVRWR